MLDTAPMRLTDEMRYIVPINLFLGESGREAAQHLVSPLSLAAEHVFHTTNLGYHHCVTESYDFVGLLLSRQALSPLWSERLSDLYRIDPGGCVVHPLV